MSTGSFSLAGVQRKRIKTTVDKRNIFMSRRFLKLKSKNCFVSGLEKAES